MKKSKTLKNLEGKERKLTEEIRSLRIKAGMTGGSRAQRTRLTALVNKKNPIQAKINNLYFKLGKS